MRKAALDIIRTAVRCSLPFENTERILSSLDFPGGSLFVLSLGKAAVPMAEAAEKVLGGRIGKGLLVTKYGHASSFSSPYFEVIEASHPIGDENSLLAAEKALKEASLLGENDCCLVLLSGGGSALFEKSRLAQEEIRKINSLLLSSGGGIEEINAIRRRLSYVKGGFFGAACYPARVITVALSDVLSNDKKSIASGITVRDDTDREFIRKTAEKYLPGLPTDIKELLYKEEDLRINDGGYYFAGDIDMLCRGAAKRASALGYTPHIVTENLRGEASDAAEKIISTLPREKGRHCYIYGGETTVTLKGRGLGGRNQEMALAAAIALKGRKNILFASAGSDGTDGPTGDAGGTADGDTYDKMISAGVCPERELLDNNSNFALGKAGVLITTGPTGTNVNDLTLVLTDSLL